MTLTLELPDSLIEQSKERQISEDELKTVAIAALEIWLTGQRSTNSGRFAQSAIPFAKSLIAENRELFEALARR